MYYISCKTCIMLIRLVGILAIAAGMTLVSAKPLVDDGLPTVSLPLTVSGNLDMIYTVAVHVGGQKFNFTLDTNARVPILFGDGFKPKEHYCADGGQRNLFNSSASPTYNFDSDYSNAFGIPRVPLLPYVSLQCGRQTNWRLDILKGSEGTDTYALDNVSSPANMKSLTVSKVPFFLVTQSRYPLNPGWASDGMFPLSTNGDGSIIYSVLKAVGGRKEVTLWLNGSPKEGGPPASGGLITFGGRDTVNCDAKWQTVDSNDNWSVKLKSVTIGANTDFGDYPDEYDVPISVASPMLIVPSAVFDNVIRGLLAEYNFELDLYTVECARTATLPGVTLTIGSNDLKYTVPVEQFVTKVNTKTGQKCVLLIVDGLGEWSIGSQFLPQRCVHLDYRRQTISFAASK